MEREAGFFEQLVEDGRPALMLFAVGLLISGTFAVFLSARREFLPHDVAFLGMTAKELCDLADCRVVRFMFHDRVAFGGSLMATAVLYLWLAVFPLRNGERWAWWAFTLSGILGFGSFVAYLGYGYLDTWHGLVALGLLPGFLLGLIQASRTPRALARRSAFTNGVNPTWQPTVGSKTTGNNSRYRHMVWGRERMAARLRDFLMPS